MSATETYTLQYPITYKGEEITELNIRRPKVRDLKKFDGIKSKMGKAIAMIADLAEIATGAVEEMDQADFNEATKIVTGFLGLSEEEIREAYARSVSS